MCAVIPLTVIQFGQVDDRDGAVTVAAGIVTTRGDIVGKRTSTRQPFTSLSKTAHACEQARHRVRQ